MPRIIAWHIKTVPDLHRLCRRWSQNGGDISHIAKDDECGAHSDARSIRGRSAHCRNGNSSSRSSNDVRMLNPSWSHVPCFAPHIVEKQHDNGGVDFSVNCGDFRQESRGYPCVANIPPNIKVLYIAAEKRYVTRSRMGYRNDPDLRGASAGGSPGAIDLALRRATTRGGRRRRSQSCRRGHIAASGADVGEC